MFFRMNKSRCPIYYYLDNLLPTMILILNCLQVILGVIDCGVLVCGIELYSGIRIMELSYRVIVWCSHLKQTFYFDILEH